MEKMSVTDSSKEQYIIPYNNVTVKALSLKGCTLALILCVCAFYNFFGLYRLYLLLAFITISVVAYFLLQGLLHKNKTIRLSLTGITLPNSSKEILWDDILYMDFKDVGEFLFPDMLIVLKHKHEEVWLKGYGYYCADEKKLARVIEEMAHRHLFTRHYTIYEGKRASKDHNMA